MNFDAKLILAEIRENQMRLDNCPRHHFPTLPPTDQIPGMLNLKLDCSICGGRIDALQAYAYARGYEAAGGDANDIIPGWR